MRVHFIDTLKGFGIMLVVFAHHSLPANLEAYIYSFHMPLFFFISGFLFDFGKYAESFSIFIKKRLSSLMVPYLCFALLAYLIYFSLEEVFPDFFESGNFYNFISAILYAPGDIDIVNLINPPLWFLPCLFVTGILFYGFTRICYGDFRKLSFCIIAAGVVGYLYPVFVPFRLPWAADVALSAVVFYGAGNLFRRFTDSEVKSASSIVFEATSKLKKIFPKIEKFLPNVLLLSSLLYFGYLIEFPETGSINMASMQYGNFFSFYLLAFLGIFTFIYFFKKIGSSGILEYYGKNSLIVLALHYPTMYIVITLIFLIFGVDLNFDYYNAGIALGLAMLNLILLAPIIYIINNYFPFVLGKGSSKSFEAHIRK